MWNTVIKFCGSISAQMGLVREFSEDIEGQDEESTIPRSVGTH